MAVGGDEALVQIMVCSWMLDAGDEARTIQPPLTFFHSAAGIRTFDQLLHGLGFFSDCVTWTSPSWRVMEMGIARYRQYQYCNTIKSCRR